MPLLAVLQTILLETIGEIQVQQRLQRAQTKNEIYLAMEKAVKNRNSDKFAKDRM